MEKKRNIFWITTIIVGILYLIILFWGTEIFNEKISEDIEKIISLGLTVTVSLSVIFSVNVKIDKSNNYSGNVFNSGSSLEEITKFIKENDLKNEKEIISIIQDKNARKNAIYFDFNLVRKYIDTTNAWMNLVKIREGFNNLDLCGFVDFFYLTEIQFNYERTLIIDSKIRELLDDTMDIVSEILYERTTYYSRRTDRIIHKVKINPWGDIDIFMDEKSNPNDPKTYQYDYENKIKDFKQKYDIFYQYIREKKFIADTQ